MRPMRVYVFASQIDLNNVIGFSLDKDGANLPSDFGPWVREDMPGILVHIETDDPISDVVKREGYYVVDNRNVH
jgi:hypothetical protein